MPTASNIFKVSALTAALALSYPGDVLSTEPAAKQSSSRSPQQQSSELSSNVREQTASAEDLLAADVHQVTNPIGSVRDLVLNSEGTAVQYVLYEIPFPYTAFDGAENGFVAFDNLAVEPGTGFDNALRIDDEASRQAPEQLKLERNQADHRLVSNLLDDQVRFSDGTTRRVEDLLIDRQSGEIRGYVINRNPDAWFNDQPAIVPPDQVEIGQRGDITTTAEFAALEGLQ